jgi:hypothetical protein
MSRYGAPKGRRSGAGDDALRRAFRNTWAGDVPEAEFEARFKVWCAGGCHSVIDFDTIDARVVAEHLAQHPGDGVTDAYAFADGHPPGSARPWWREPTAWPWDAEAVTA